MEKLYYSISEVAGLLSERESLVRYWSDQFGRFVKPVRNAKGNRQYRSEDVEMLRKIHYLVKGKGLTLDGARRELSDERLSVDKTTKALESLKAIRAQLVEIKEIL